LRGRVRAVVFDYDGTLAEHADNAELLRTILGAHTAEPVSLEAIWGATSDFQLVDAFVPTAQRESAARQILAVNLGIAARPRRVPGLVSVLRVLANDYRLFVYSGRDQGSLEAALRHQRLSRWFAEIKGAGAGIPAKPHPAPLLALLRHHGIHPTEAVYVGDGHADGKLAAAAGCGYVVAGWFRGTRRVPGALGYSRSVADLTTLLRPLTQGRGGDVPVCGCGRTAGIR
jgi:phosphoglycolate phosphatase